MNSLSLCVWSYINVIDAHVPKSTLCCRELLKIINVKRKSHKDLNGDVIETQTCERDRRPPRRRVTAPLVSGQCVVSVVSNSVVTAGQLVLTDGATADDNDTLMPTHTECRKFIPGRTPSGYFFVAKTA